MDTFWGSETESLSDLGAVFGRRAESTRRRINEVGVAVRAVMWVGPDAEEFRRQAEEWTETAIGVVEALRRLGELLEGEAEEQERCSAPEGDGAAPTGPTSPDSPFADSPWPFLGPPKLRQGDPSGQGGDPSFPSHWGPWVGGPLMGPAPWEREPFPPLPDGEDLLLDPAAVEDGAGIRRGLVRMIPGGGPIQALPGLHESVGGVLDGAQRGLEEHGLGRLAPVLAPFRVSHALSSVAVGEESVLVNTLDGVDRSIGNLLQTGDEVSTAIGEGDLGGAAGALERGAYRHTEVFGDLLTTTSVPALAGATADVLDVGADTTELFSPEAAEPLREAQHAAEQLGTDWEAGREALTDTGRLYAMRREHMPMPWDARG